MVPDPRDATRTVAAYPGAALFAFVVSWAFEAKKMPSEIWALYEKNPRDFAILAAYSIYRAQKEEAESKRQSTARGVKSRTVHGSLS